MFKNYVVTALNNLLKNKLFSFINIAGLSIGLAACILIALFVQGETSWDKHWSDAERIYRINTVVDRTGSGSDTNGAASELLIPSLPGYFGEEIEATTRIEATNRQVLVRNERFDLTISEVDAGVTGIFDFDVLAGDLDATLGAPANLALNVTEAQRLFGVDGSDTGALQRLLGEVLTVVAVANGNEIRVDLRLGAIYRLPEGDTVLAGSMPALIQEFVSNCGRVWLSLCSPSFVKLAPGVDVSDIEARFPEFADRFVDISAMGAGPGVLPSQRVSFSLQNIADIYLDSPFETSNRGNKVMVLAFSGIAVLVLLIGCINFTILSTAKAAQRAREVAMRKTVGATRLQLALQFLGETFCIVLPALMLSVVLVEMSLPVFEGFIGKSLDVSYLNPLTWLSMLGLLLLVAFLGGFYPALVLSRFRPATTLQSSRSMEIAGSVSLRNTLVVFQFAVSIALMVATFAIYAQVRYTMERDPGFNRENLLFVGGLARWTDAQQNAFKAEVVRLPGVSTASLSGFHYMQRNGGAIPATAFREGAAEPYQLVAVGVDHDFFGTYQYPFLGGRDFDDARDQPSPLYSAWQEPTSESSAVLNASAVRSMGFSSPEDALGSRITVSGFNAATHYFTVIGVVDDVALHSARAAPRAEVYVIPQQRGYLTGALTVRYQGDPQNLLAGIEQAWQEVRGESGASVSFVDQNMALEFARENTEARLLVSFSLLAIAIACLGLFGSAAFNVERRTKEIGIRKVLGAEVREIVTLLLWQFSKPVMIANVIAWPLAIWAMMQWLQRFAYRIDMLVMIPLCVLASVIALSIAWLTVAGNTVRVATTKPVYALRYE